MVCLHTRFKQNWKWGYTEGVKYLVSEWKSWLKRKIVNNHEIGQQQDWRKLHFVNNNQKNMEIWEDHLKDDNETGTGHSLFRGGWN